MTSKVHGLGCDIIEIERIKKAVKEHDNHFLSKLFTQKERDAFQERRQSDLSYYTTISGRFAAKEAISKALGTGFGDALKWLDIEILSNSNGKPVLSPKCNLSIQLAEEKRFINLSISHCKSYAMAVACIT